MIEPYYQDDLATIYHGSCVELAPQLEGITAVVSDPPYELGFMGKSWDSSGVAFQVETWEAIKAACLPGAMCLAFGGTRTFHRLVCAIEDAGFEVRDTIMWIYGSGFPKSLDISKAIDKARNEDLPAIVAVTKAMRDALETSGKRRSEIDEHFGTANVSQYWFSPERNPQIVPVDRWPWVRDFLEIGTDLDSEVWRLNGRKGKPGDNWEKREVVGQKTAGLGSGKTYAFTEENNKAKQTLDITTPSTEHAKTWNGYGSALKPAHEPVCVAMKPLDGTFASNAVEHGVAGINVDGCRVDYNGEKPSGWFDETERKNVGFKLTEGANNKVTSTPGTGRWPANVITDGSDQVVGLFPETSSGQPRDDRGTGGIWSDGNGIPCGQQYGDSGSAARFFYTAKAASSEREIQPAEDFPLWGESYDAIKNTHATVKPLALMEYLIKLVTMPTRNLILDPFGGSGSTIVAAKKSGIPAIMIELDESHCEIAANRLNK